MSPVPFLSSHHNPHSAPLRDVQGLNDPWYFIHKADSSSDVVQDLHVSYLKWVHQISLEI